MTVTQLIEMLQDLEAQGKGGMEVQTSYSSGDYWGTTVAHGIDELEEAIVKYSEYHSMDKVVEYDADDEGQPAEDSRTVIMLS